MIVSRSSKNIIAFRHNKKKAVNKEKTSVNRKALKSNKISKEHRQSFFRKRKVRKTLSKS